MLSQKYNIYCYIPHFRDTYFKEIIDSLVLELANKHKNVKVDNHICPDSINIVFSANNIENYIRFPEDTIIFNLEQLHDKSRWLTETYLQYLRGYQIWDYSKDNIKWLYYKGITNVKHVNIGYSQAFITTLDQEDDNNIANKDIDVLFFGAINNRRQAIVNKLLEYGINIVVAACWSYEREKLMRRSKIILNMHYFETAILEILRIIPCIANKHFIISETSHLLDDNREWLSNIVFVDYDNLVDTIKYYLDHTDLIPDKIDIAHKFYKTLEYRLPI